MCRGRSHRSLEAEHDKDAELPCEAGQAEGPRRQQDVEVRGPALAPGREESHI